MGFVTLFNARSSPYLAKGDKVTDDTVALQTAAFAAKYAQGSASELYIPAGVYLVTSTINAWDCFGMNIRGAGKGRTIIFWAGPPTSPIFSIDGTAQSISDMTIVSSTGTTAGIRISGAVADNPITTACIVRNIRFEGSYTYCIDITFIGSATGDNNNELHWISGCNFDGYTNSGIHIHASQSHGNRIEDCTFDGRQVAINGVWCEYGSYIHARRNLTKNHTSNDYYLQDFIINNTIRDCVSRNSSRFVLVGGANAGALAPVRISGCDVDHGSYLNSVVGIFWGCSIFMNIPCPLIIKNTRIKASNVNPYIRPGGLSNDIRLSVSSCLFIGPSDYTYARTYNATTGRYYEGCLQNNALARVQDGGNLYYKPSAGTYEQIVLSGSLGVQAMDNAGVSTPSKNSFFSTSFSGGAQQQTVTLAYAEADAAYDVLDLAVEISSGSTTAVVSAAIENKTTTGFDVRLNTPASGFTVNVAGFIGRIS